MPSIGFQNPISGSSTSGPNRPIINNAAGRPVLGGGIRGFVARGVNDTDNNDEYAQIRFTLRNGWNTTYVSQLGNQRRIITPFRAVTNSGDILCRTDYSWRDTKPLRRKWYPPFFLQREIRVRFFGFYYLLETKGGE